MIRRRRLTLTPGPDRILPDPEDPTLPQVSPSQPAPTAPVPPPVAPPVTAPTDPSPAAPAEPPSADPGKPTREGRSVVPPASLDAADDASLSRPSPTDPLRAEPLAALQLELRRVPLARRERDTDDLPRPRADEVAARPRGVWMIADDDDRFLRRSGRDDLWSLQRAHRRPQVQPTL